MKFICSLIVVDDIARARYFYETVLGQKVVTDFGENVSFEGGFAIHQRRHFLGLINGKEIVAGGNCFELYFEDDEVDAVFAKLEGIGVTFVHGVVEQPWKQRVIRFYDPDLNMVEIGERMEHVAFRLSSGHTVGEISAITYLPENLVRGAIESYGKIQVKERQGA